MNQTPVQSHDGFLPIRDHGLIGDGSTAALVGRDGGVKWLCLPRFDSEPAFASLLDAERGGEFSIRPASLRASGQRYVERTGVLVTEMSGEGGRIRVTDALILRSGADLTEDQPAERSELVRSVEALEDARVEVSVRPLGGADTHGTGGRVELRCLRRGALDLVVHSTHPIDPASGTVELRAGERMDLLLAWGGGAHRHDERSPQDLLESTVSAWREWAQHIAYDGPRAETVERAAITLKLLDHFHNGAIVAAPTSSLPEHIGGVRNWDYRYSWVRDAAFSVYAMRRIGLTREAAGFLAWVLDALEGQERALVMYDIDGREVPPEVEDEELRGYRGSRPVRWGNDAAHQNQNDVYGEILDCAYQWNATDGDIDETLWSRLRPLIDAARERWREPDHGIWEVRTPGRPFTYSAALCHVALDRGRRLAERLGLEGDREAWGRAAEKIRRTILEEAWDEELGAIREHLGGGGLDASILSLPLRRVVRADHPKMVATSRAVAEHLGAGDGLLYRYDPEQSPDGLAGDEGAFLLCSFWLVDNLTYQGRLDEATELYESLCGRTNELGLLPEQIDPTTGAFLGNFPQAFSHVGVISSGYNLSRHLRQRESR